MYAGGAKGDHGVQVMTLQTHTMPTSASVLPMVKWLYDTVSRNLSPPSLAPDVCLVAAKGDNGTQIIVDKHCSIFESNNQNPAYAKAGDTLRVAFAVDDVFT